MKKSKTALMYGNPNATLFQVRDKAGRRRLESENKRAVAEFLNRQPKVDGWDVLTLAGKPGRVLAVTPATKFISQSETKP